jgi:hypothetical protein
MLAQFKILKAEFLSKFWKRVMRTKYDIYVFINDILASTLGLMLAFVDDVYVLIIDELLGLESIFSAHDAFLE